MNHQRPLRVNRHQRLRGLRRAQARFFIDCWLRYNEACKILGHEPYRVLEFTEPDAGCYVPQLPDLDALNARFYAMTLFVPPVPPCPSQNNSAEPSISPKNTEAS